MTEPHSTPADRNVERLISEAYQPEALDAGFIVQVYMRLDAETARRRQDMPRTIAWRRLAAVAAVLALIVVPAFLLPKRESHKADTAQNNERALPAERILPRPRIASPALPRLEEGQTLATDATQKRRVQLPDDTLVSLNRSTRVRLDADRRLTLLEGEVYIEVTPKSERAPFVIQSQRTITVLGTKLAVRREEDGDRVLVTQGKVQVEGISEILKAGEWLSPGSDKPAPAPRASHALDWVRDLLTPEMTLVPPSAHSGGALVARGPDGNEASLSLRKYHVDVHVEDGFARTTIDQTYFNHHYGRLEGTFWFPLPADASLSRLAMYVEGTRMEGGMVERDHGRAVYESIVRSQKDPALLEWVDGTTFRMRVFPLEGRQEKRIILSYTQRLPSLHGEMTYRFPSGHNLDVSATWSFHARLRHGALDSWTSPTHALNKHAEGEDLILSASSKGAKLDKDLVLEGRPGRPRNVSQDVRIATTKYDGKHYLMLRAPFPNEPRALASGSAPRRDWTILFESSAERDPLLARTQIEIIRTLLENAEHDDTFAIVTANNRAKTLVPRQTATTENVRAALAALEQTHLIGGLDLGNALSTELPDAKGRSDAKGQSVLVHVGGGQPRLGQRRTETLLKFLPENTQYVGIGVGKRWNRAFMKQAAEKTGGWFTSINPDESVAWRTFDLLATLNMPRLLNVRVADPADDAPLLDDAAPWPLEFLSETTLLSQGEEICAVARTELPPEKWPATVVVTGTRDGQPFRQELKLGKPASDANYLPRFWGRLEIDRLLAEDAKKHKTAITELSKHLYVMSPYTSLLVLETPEMYERFKVDRGRKDHWAAYQCPEKIDVFHEPPEGQGEKLLVKGNAVQLPTGKKKLDDVRRSILVRRMSYSQARDMSGVDHGWYTVAEPRRRQIDIDEEIVFPPAARWKSVVSKYEMHKSRGFFRISEWEDRGMPSGSMDPVVASATEIHTLVGIPQDWSGLLPARNRVIVIDNSGSMDPTDFIERHFSGTDGVPIMIPPPPGSGSGMAGQAVDFATRLASSFDGDIPALSPMPDGLPAFLEPRWRFDPVDGESKNEQKLLKEQIQGGPRIPTRLFRDLTLYAPGLNTTHADVQATLDAEAALPQAPVRGRISDAARALVTKHRALGWRMLAIPATRAFDGFTIHFDGAGRYRYERVLACGLREIVVCDGTTLWHLYPEIGLASKRTVSRFHRAAFNAIVPQALPPAEDLAINADVEDHDGNTLVVIPHQGRYLVHLVLDKDGRLVERRWLDKTTRKVVQQHPVAEARAIESAPDLKPDVAALVVLPMPWRAGGDEKKLDADSRLAQLFAEQNRDELHKRVRLQFLAKGDRRPGLFVLLVAAGCTNETPLPPGLHRDTPLGKYLSHFESEEKKKDEKESTERSKPPVDFIGRMQKLHDLKGIIEAPMLLSSDFEASLLQTLHTSRTPPLAWLLLQGAAVRLTNADEKPHANRLRLLAAIVAAAAESLRDVPELRFPARFEQARALHRLGKHDEARAQFEALLTEAIKAGEWLDLDKECRAAFQQAGVWPATVHRIAELWLAHKDGGTVAAVALSRQIRALGDVALADEVLDRVVSHEKTADQPRGTLAAIVHHYDQERYDRAAALLETLLARPKLAVDPELWRMAARINLMRDKKTKGMNALETALDLEWTERPATLSLEAIRREYALLLDHYQRQARAAAELEQPAPDGLLDKTLRAIERWRALDPKGPHAQKAVDVLLALNEQEWAWDYLTTALATDEATPEKWHQEAAKLNQTRHYDLAARCKRQAEYLER